MTEVKFMIYLKESDYKFELIIGSIDIKLGILILKEKHIIFVFVENFLIKY